MEKSIATDTLPVLVYDCFSDTRFGGNVGGLVLNANDLSAEMMQNIAREINAPVTGFVTGQDGRDVTIRFFMPAAEIAMCGHVTIGLFSYLSEEGGFDDGAFTMNAPAGAVKVKVTKNRDTPPNVFMEVGLPKLKASEVCEQDLAEALGLKVEDLGTLNPLETAEAGLNHLFVQLENLEAVRDLAPDFRKLTDVSNTCGVNTVACFSMETTEAHNTIHIRDFCPAVGADEVPASGTTNGALMGYLVRHGLVPAGAQTVLAEQGAELGRPSLIRCEITSADGVLTSVQVGGQAVASLKGTVSGG